MEGVSLMADFDGTHICIFESLKLEGSYVGTSCNPFHPHTSSWGQRWHYSYCADIKVRFGEVTIVVRVHISSGAWLPVLSTLPWHSFCSYGGWPCITATEEFRSQPGMQSQIQVVCVSHLRPGSGRMQGVNIILGWFLKFCGGGRIRSSSSLDVAFGKLDLLNLWQTVWSETTWNIWKGFGLCLAHTKCPLDAVKVNK